MTVATGEVSIAGLSKGAVLAALYNRSRPQGMGFLHYDPTPMTAEQGEQAIQDANAYQREYYDENRAQYEARCAENPAAFEGYSYPEFEPKLYFDYFRGRVIKTDISGDTIRTGLFDRDNGQGAAEQAIATLRSGATTSPDIDAAHRENTIEALAVARQMRGESSTVTRHDGVTVYRMTLEDVPELDEELDRAAAVLFGRG